MKRIILLLCVMGLVVALWSGAWLFIAGQISQQVELAARPANPETPSLSCTNFSVTGFPFRFDATCKGAKMNDGDVTVTLAELKLTALVYRPTHLLAFAQSPLHISDAFYGTEQELRFDKIEASLRLNGWQLKRFSMIGENLAYYDTLLGDALLASSPAAEAHLLDIPAEHDPETRTADLALYLKTVNTDITMFGISEGQLTTEARLTNMPDDVRAFAQAQAMQNWQAADGEFILERLAANDPFTNIEMTGQMRLDETGAINGKIEGRSDQLAERFEAVVPPEQRTLFFGARQPDGTYTQAINIIKGTVFVGIAPQGTLPPLF